MAWIFGRDESGYWYQAKRSFAFIQRFQRPCGFLFSKKSIFRAILSKRSSITCGLLPNLLANAVAPPAAIISAMEIRSMNQKKEVGFSAV